jgi:sterol desaturase/sphingolipid hydroxylase (fatty acid hydroxylase superfamily)
MRALAGFLIGSSLLAAVFSILERLSPSIRGQRWWRRGTGTDLIYLAMQPLVFKPLVRGITGVALALLAIWAGARPERDAIVEWLTQRDAPLGRLPIGIQAVLALLVADFVGYWNHRLFHGKALWRFHAVHHSSEELDWLASVRAHPVNEIITGAAHALVLVALGFRVDVLAGVVPFLTLYAILLHANVSWSFGPLRYVLASPTFHRWHHTAQEEGLDKNFAGLLPLWDLMFGTFYMPEGRAPVRFGLFGERLPEGFWRQLAWPFQRRG